MDVLVDAVDWGEGLGGASRGGQAGWAGIAGGQTGSLAGVAGPGGHVHGGCAIGG